MNHSHHGLDEEEDDDSAFNDSILASAERALSPVAFDPLFSGELTPRGTKSPMLETISGASLSRRDSPAVDPIIGPIVMTPVRNLAADFSGAGDSRAGSPAIVSESTDDDVDDDPNCSHTSGTFYQNDTLITEDTEDRAFQRYCEDVIPNLFKEEAAVDQPVTTPPTREKETNLVGVNVLSKETEIELFLDESRRTTVSVHDRSLETTYTEGSSFDSDQHLIGLVGSFQRELSEFEADLRFMPQTMTEAMDDIAEDFTARDTCRMGSMYCCGGGGGS